jgi:transcriptional regulator with XRE-family HTH domain
MTVMQGFGERLAQERREKAARERRDIGQKDVAEAIGSSGPSVSRWESGVGMPSEAMIVKLATYFGVKPAWLRYGQEPRIDAGAPLIPLTRPQRVVLPRGKGKGGESA